MSFDSILSVTERWMQDTIDDLKRRLRSTTLATHRVLGQPPTSPKKPKNLRHGKYLPLNVEAGRVEHRGVSHDTFVATAIHLVREAQECARGLIAEEYDENEEVQELVVAADLSENESRELDRKVRDLVLKYQQRVDEVAESYVAMLRQAEPLQ